MATACGSAPSKASGQSGSVLPDCGVGQAAQTDGSCVPVGPSIASTPLFYRSTDGWGFDATYASPCTGSNSAVLGDSKCRPLDDCSAAFPPAGADEVVSSTLSGPKVVADLKTALAFVPLGGTIAIDAGHWGSVNLAYNVTLVGRCARLTILGNGTNNAVYVNGPKVALRSMTLVGPASAAVAIASGNVAADQVIVQETHVGIGVIGKNASATFRHSIIEGPGSGQSSLGAMVAQGGTLVFQDSEFRQLPTAVFVSDPGSTGTVQRSIVNVGPGSASDSGLIASASGVLHVEQSVVTSKKSRLADVHLDVGTVGTTKTSGKLVFSQSLLEQGGAEMTDNTPLSIDAGEMDLTDVTFRHQALIGALVSSGGTLHLERTAVLGNQASAQARVAAAVMQGSTVDGHAVAVPWAQGIAFEAYEGSKLDLTSSLLSGVVARGAGQEAVLVSNSEGTLTACDLRNNEDDGVIGIAGSTLTVQRTAIHGSYPQSGDVSTAVLALHTNLTLDGSVLESDGEGLIAAGSGIIARSTSFVHQDVAIRAMAGMKILQGATTATPNSIALGSDCKFIGDKQRESFDTLPKLNAAPFPPPTN